MVNPIITVMSWPFRKIKDAKIKIVNAFSASEKIPMLDNEILNLKNQLSEFKYTRSENAQLKKELNFIPEYSLKYLTAPIRLNDSGILASSFIIDAGHDKKVERYQPAIVNGAYVGQVSNVFDNYSRITLITDSQSKIPVMIERNRVRSFIQGDNTKYPKLIHFETKDPVVIGDRVITSGLEEKTPKGIIVGIVIQVDTENGIIVQPIVDKSEIEFVKIVQKIKPLSQNSDNVFHYKFAG